MASVLDAHPNLIAKHLPVLATKLRDVLTLDQWQRGSPDSRGFDVKWVDFSGRDRLKVRIQQHLLASEGPAVLHIAGLSGVGKTRTVIQACLDDDRLCDTLYVRDYARLRDEFLRHIESPGRHIRAIVDEVPLEDHDRLPARFRDCADRIRLVTLGPAKRGERTRAHSASLLIMDEPDTTDGVLKVVQQAGPNLAPDVQESIAQRSAHDLKLALLLVRAALENPELGHLRVCNLDDVWNRVTALFGNHFRNIASFPTLYEKLTVAVDVGREGRHRSELEYVAKHLGVQAQELDRAIDAADQSGLGLRTPQFFEAVPRALAVWVFSDRLWRALEPTVDAFLTGMPTDRLRRRFIERCQEVDGQQRREVLDRVGRFFLSFLGDPKLARLSDRETSRVFEAWAELDPERGLPWLVSAVEQAAEAEITGFDGSPDGSGGWRGRRQIVWLCEHLACFKEYFWDCERTLFRLAQVETEESIGNNSRNIWKGMFLPILSNTEVPFPERWAHLLTRLLRADQQTSALVLSAVMGVFDDIAGRVAPPSVVGGRIVPDEWRPRTIGELRDHLRSSAKEMLSILPGLEKVMGARAVAELIQHLDRFACLDIFEELRAGCAIAMDDPALLRALRAQLDYLIAHEVRERESSPSHLGPLRAWRASINPSTLKDEMIDLTSREAWFAYDTSAHDEIDAPERVYGEMARRALHEREALNSLEDWFSLPECRSGGELGFALGKADPTGELLPLALRWLSAARALGIASSYLQAVSSQAGALPAEAVEVLDDLAQRRPALAVSLSVGSDRSDRGFERIVNCLGRLDPGQRAVLRRMAFDDWPKMLTETQKDRLLAELGALTDSTDPGALAVALDLLAGWSEHGKVALPRSLMARGLNMLQLAAKPTLRVDGHDWKILTELIAPEFPSEVARIFADAITDVDLHRHQRRQYAVEGFKKLAPRHPAVAMEAIGRCVMDTKRGTIFRIRQFRGLFDAIGLETVRTWVAAHGPVAAIRIARHLHGPHLDGQGNPVVPDLADWLLTEFENEADVFREFCMGRHSGVVRWGHARDHREEVERLVGAFRSDARRWVQQWAKYELDELEFEIKYDDQHEDEIERT